MKKHISKIKTIQSEEPEPSEVAKEFHGLLNDEPEPLSDYKEQGPITINLPSVNLKGYTLDEKR